MNEWKRTAIYVAVSGALLATAVLANRPSGRTSADFNDQGQPLFPSFTLPEQATSLEVAEFDPTTGEARPFKVALVSGRWVVPSHFDYPADARERLAMTAGSVLGLNKDTIRSDRPEDHRKMGVVDPLDPKVTSYEGLGRRITLRDKNDAVLADLIVGLPVPGQANQRFVRVPGQNRVYGVNLERLELSTRFSDWIDQNLLSIVPASVRSIVFDTHKVDAARRTLDPGEQITVTRARPKPGERSTPATEWSVPDVPADREPNATALNDLASTLANLKIAGVRRKPPGLTAGLRSTDGPAQVTETDMLSLMQRGFYLTRDGLRSAEGNVYVATDDGVLYILHFGNVTFARGEALSAGTGDEPAEASAAEGTPDSSGESRYLFVTTQFQPERIPKPPVREAGELPANPFAMSPAERAADDARRADETKREQEDYARKVAEGEKKSRDLNERFAAWYYVVPGDAFRKIVLNREGLTRPKSAAPAAPGGMPSFPGMPGGGGLPGLPPGFGQGG
jgi:hypothetical protein